MPMISTMVPWTRMCGLIRFSMMIVAALTKRLVIIGLRSTGTWKRSAIFSTSRKVRRPRVMATHGICFSKNCRTRAARSSAVRLFR